MKFNIIALLVITCFLNTSICFLRHNSPDATLIGNDGIRFMQKALSTEEENKEKSKAGYKYNGDLLVVKETDPADTKLTSQNAIIVLEKKTVNILDLKTNAIQVQADYLK